MTHHGARFGIEPREARDDSPSHIAAVTAVYVCDDKTHAAVDISD